MLIAAVVFAFLTPVYAQDLDIKTLIANGRIELQKGRYKDAIEMLSQAYEKSPIIGDYILFWLSKAYREQEDFNSSNIKLKELLNRYPDTPLKRKVRAAEIKNNIALGDNYVSIETFESYVKDYPDDQEMKFILAYVYKSQGNYEKSRQFFKNIYIANGGIYSRVAYNEITLSDITVSDLIEKATNLINAMEFKEAESVLREALFKDSNKQYSVVISKKLGNSLFRQRKFKESAEIYDKTGDYYSKAKALYRSGDKQAFDQTLKKLSATNDPKTGAIMLLAANDKKRNNEIDEALAIYKKIKDSYPSEMETALWETGWLYYLRGSYKKASDIFSELYSGYGNVKYLYWQARSFEKEGRDVTDIYKNIVEKNTNYYSMLAGSKIGTFNITSQETSRKIKANFSSTSKIFSSERINLLVELGMKKEAATELSMVAKKTGAPDDVIEVCKKLHETGEYRLPLLLVSRVIDRDAARDILYPLAHWDIIKEASDRYNSDPLVIISIIREESRFDPEARSIAGALGLMQLMPQTAYSIAKKINFTVTKPVHIYDVKTNINLGSYYIGRLVNEFNSLPLAIASYNAGENAVKKWQKANEYKSYDEFIEDIPYDETRNYVKRVLTTYFEYLKLSGEETPPKIF